MLFNSFQFAVFFTIVYFVYLLLSHKWQNRMLLAASYVFYGFWDWRFISLLLISTGVDYYCALRIDNATGGKRKGYLFLSIFINLAILGFFKYFNFFSSNLALLLENMGIHMSFESLNIILPLGISFYTFQTMSYTIDVYRGRIRPSKNLLDVALFVAFFPQLVAGPIERAKNLLPQISSPRIIDLDQFYEGCYLIFWGLFQKIYIADNLAKIVDTVFTSSGTYNGADVMTGIYAFAFQIFCDFAGYSNIARGVARCMGFDIMINFNLPYFSSNPSEFWKRWHISLSSWLKDYLYIPMGGNRKGKFKTYRNLGLTMLLGGLWHGAAWTYVLWGIYHGILLSSYRITASGTEKAGLNPKKSFTNQWYWVKVIIFFHLVCLGWLIFRATSVSQLWSMTEGIISNFNLQDSKAFELVPQMLLFIFPLIAVQIFQLLKKDLMCLYKANVFIRAVFYALCIYLMIKKKYVTEMN